MEVGSDVEGTLGSGKLLMRVSGRAEGVQASKIDDRRLLEESVAFQIVYPLSDFVIIKLRL